MDAREKETYLEIRHDAAGLLEISNQYTLAFDSQRFSKKIVVALKGIYDEDLAARIPADQVIFLNLSKVSGLNLATVIKLVRVCKTLNVSHIVAHRYKPAFIAGLIALFYKPVTVFAVMHGNHQFNRLSRRLAAKILFSRKNFKIIGVSYSTRDDINAALPTKNPAHVAAVQNCIDIDNTRNQLLDRQTARSRLQVSSDLFVFGNIGRLSPAKDQSTLLRAFHFARPKMPNSVLVIIGSGRLEARLKQEVKQLNINQHVIFTGAIDQAWKYMNAFDGFVATSVTEGFGLVIVEAMVAKTPLVATDIGSFKEIVGNTIELLECGNSKLIGEALLKLYSMTNTERTRIGNSLYQRVQAEFSVEIFRKRIKRLYATS